MTRPYDYVTDRTILATPGGPVKLLHTNELEPTATGTTIHFRFAAPESQREVEAMGNIGPAYGEALRAAIPGLTAQLDAVLATRYVDRGAEPDLPGRRPVTPV